MEKERKSHRRYLYVCRWPLIDWKILMRMWSKRKCCRLPAVTMHSGPIVSARVNNGEAEPSPMDAGLRLDLKHHAKAGPLSLLPPRLHDARSALSARRCLSYHCSRPSPERFRAVDICLRSCARAATRTALRLRITVASRKTTGPRHHGRSVSHLHPEPSRHLHCATQRLLSPALLPEKVAHGRRQDLGFTLRV